MSEPVGDFLRGNGWRESPRWQPSSPRFGGVAAEFGVRSPETLPRTPSLAYCTLQVGGWAGRLERQQRGKSQLSQAALLVHWSGAAGTHPFGRALTSCCPPCPALRPPLCCLQSRFGEVLDALVSRHLHRLFICDAEMRPAGVLSCTDILRLVAGEAD